MAATVTVTNMMGKAFVYRKQARGHAPIVLGLATGRTLCQRICSGVFCVYGLDVTMVAVASSDTTFTYEFRQCDYALTVAQQAEIRAFIAGMIEMWRLSA